MKAYKLTDNNYRTRNNTVWGENVSHTATGFNKELCSAGWIHFYTDPLIAVFMNSVHADFTCPRLWECETAGEHLHEPLKSGCKTLTTIKEIPLPEVTITQRIAFGILCVKEVYKDKEWNEWADKWLSGEDRSSYVAYAAYDAAYTAYTAADGAAYTAADGAAYAAAAYAAYAAACAAEMSDHCVVGAVAHAAFKTSNAADSMGFDPFKAYIPPVITINFSEIAKKALTYK